MDDGQPPVLMEVADRVARVTLNRPERLNALDTQSFEELERLAGLLGAGEDVGAVVLTGAGRAFCSGADLVSFPQDVDVTDAHAVRERLRWVGSIVERWVRLEKPTIAAVNGPALGGGCNLALACDLVLMREDAVIGEVYTQRALVPDMGGTYLLPRLVGRARAMELALFGDPLTALEAERIGLVNRCLAADEFEETVDKWALRLASGPARALAMTKTGLLQSPELSLDAALEWEAQAIAMAFQSADSREAFAAFEERREPRYGRA